MLGAFRRALDAIAQLTEALVTGLVRSGYDPQDRGASIDLLTPVLTEIIRAQRVEAHRAAAEFIREAASAQGVDDPYVPALGGYGEEAVRTVLRQELRGPVEDAVEIIAPSLRQHTESAARETVARTAADGRSDAGDDEERPYNAQDEPEGSGQRALSWARVLSGAENCAFCVMLASRGPVYGSSEDAGRQAADEIWDDAKGYTNSYHAGCDCLVVPIYDFASWPGRDSWRALEEFYQDTVENPLWNGERVDAPAGGRGDPSGAKNPRLAAIERELAALTKQGDKLPIEDVRSQP